MSDWPSDDAAGIPRPELVAAWLELNTLPTERVPLWAAHWIADGRDGASLVALAGLHGDDPHLVRDLLPQALCECGTVPPDPSLDVELTRRAAATVAFDAIARLHLDGLASAYWVVQKVVEAAGPFVFPDSITGLPLGELFTLDDEWGAGWGRTEPQLRAVVRQACLAQIGLQEESIPCPR